jgi:hypothetical protein
MEINPWPMALAPARATLVSHQQINRRDKHEETTTTTELPISEWTRKMNSCQTSSECIAAVLILVLLFDRFAELNHTFASGIVSTEEIIRIVNDD